MISTIESLLVRQALPNQLYAQGCQMTYLLNCIRMICEVPLFHVTLISNLICRLYKYRHLTTKQFQLWPWKHSWLCDLEVVIFWCHFTGVSLKSKSAREYESETKRMEEEVWYWKVSERHVLTDEVVVSISLPVRYCDCSELIMIFSKASLEPLLPLLLLKVV